MNVSQELPILHLSVLPGNFYVRKVSKVPEDVLQQLVEGSQSFLSITRTAEEISIVGQSVIEQEGDWKCIKIAGPMPFELTGILNGLLEPLKKANIGIFAISTWNTDFCLVPKSRIEDALVALTQSGWIFDA